MKVSGEFTGAIYRALSSFSASHVLASNLTQAGLISDEDVIYGGTSSLIKRTAFVRQILHGTSGAIHQSAAELWPGPAVAI